MLYRHDVYAKQLEILVAATPHSVAMNLVVAAIAVGIHSGQVPHLPLGVWSRAGLDQRLETAFDQIPMAVRD